MIQQLAYISTSEMTDLDADMDNILTASRQNNKALGVTGVLLFAQGTLFQVIEGEADVLDRLYHKISADPRHSNVTELLRDDISERRFGEWEMGWSRVPESHPAAGRIAALGRHETHAAESKGTDVDVLIDSFFELNQT